MLMFSFLSKSLLSDLPESFSLSSGNSESVIKRIYKTAVFFLKHSATHFDCVNIQRLNGGGAPLPLSLGGPLGGPLEESLGGPSLRGGPLDGGPLLGGGDPRGGPRGGGESTGLDLLGGGAARS